MRHVPQRLDLVSRHVQRMQLQVVLQALDLDSYRQTTIAHLSSCDVDAQEATAHPPRCCASASAQSEGSLALTSSSRFCSRYKQRSWVHLSSPSMRLMALELKYTALSPVYSCTQTRLASDTSCCELTVGNVLALMFVSPGCCGTLTAALCVALGPAGKAC
jgi:hypothetical protein